MRPRDDTPVKLVRKRLDDEGLASYLRSFVACTEAIEVRVKSAATRSSDATTEPLDVVGRRLATGAITAVQIRFFEDDGWWCDTLLRAKDGFRLVRMREGT